MKLLFIFTLLFSINLHAQVVHCGTNTAAEVDACTVDDKLPLLLGRLYPALTYKSVSDYNAVDPCDPATIDNPDTVTIETCPVWEPKKDSYTYIDQVLDANDLPTLSFYDRLDMLLKPALSVFSSELSLWAIEVKGDIAFRDSINNMDRFYQRAEKCGYVQSNMDLLKKSILETKDIVKRNCLTSFTATLDAEDAANTKVQAITKDLQFAQKLEIEFISLMRTGIQDTKKNKRLLSKLAQVKELLNIGDIDGAREELASVLEDADFPAQAKAFLTAKLDAYLAI